MWVPRSEDDIKAAIANATLRETGTFDGKAALPQPGRNKDLAKDICAMTPDGGVLLYGVGGDDGTRPDVLSPFDLAGAAERIDQVTQTGISEPPVIEIHDILSDDHEGLGYLVVVVPASPRAPHMLTLDGDNRYWGRGAMGNRILTEGEVARLYARRERWEADREALLEEAIAGYPFQFEDPREQVGPMVVTARPVVTTPELVRAAAGEFPIHHFLQGEVARYAATHDPHPDQGTTGLEGAHALQPLGAGAWVISSERHLSFPYQARLELRMDGSAGFWHAPAINSMARRDGGEQLLLMERSITRAVHQFLATIAWVYQRAGYAGAVDVAVAVLDIEQAISATLSQAFERGPAYGARDYRRHGRVTMSELVSDVESVVRQLLMPLYEAVSVRGYDPYEPARRG